MRPRIGSLVCGRSLVLPPVRDPSNWAPLEIWVAGEDFQLLRMRWDVLKSTYDLVELDGDLR